MSRQRIVVVGAGMAGLVCAQRLQAAGYEVSVIEKSRGLGGRMATRRIDGVPFDHGARYLTPQSELLQALVRHWQQQQRLAPWQPQVYRLDSNGQLNPVTATAPHYVAPAGMSALGKALAQGLTIYQQQRAIAIVPISAHTWAVTTRCQPPGKTAQHLGDAVVLAMPAPQILPLLAESPQSTNMADFQQAIAAVSYAPCLTVMAQYTAPVSGLPAPLPDSPTAPWMIEGHADGPFFWVGLDSSKRTADSVNVVLHSSAAFVERWPEATDLQPAGAALLAQAGKLIAPWLEHPLRWQVHRWRYAHVEKACSHLPLTAAPLPLVACGDWCGDQNIDTAVTAGWEAAAAIHAELGGRALPPFPIGLPM